VLGVELMDFLDIERRFSNLENLWSGTSIEVALFKDPARASTFQKLVLLQRLLRNETDLFEPLLKWLSHLHWDLRGFVGSPENSSSHWEMRCEELKIHSVALKHSLNESRSIAISALVDALQELQRADSEYGDFLKETIDSSDSVVIVEKQWQRRFVTDFFTQAPDFESLVVTHMAAFLRGTRSVYSNTYVLAPPARIPDNYMRALILGGAIESAKFLTPNWIAGSEPQKLRHDLVPGLTSVRRPAFLVRGDILSEDLNDLSDEELDSFTYSPTQGDFDKFSSKGETKCKLVEIANEYVMPLELDASRVSVLGSSDDRGLQVEFRIPGKTLEIGDILFELRDGAEEDFLMEAAEAQMGSKFNDFARGRAEWKARARLLIKNVGVDAAVTQLRALGVETADNLLLWLDNEDFTTPRATKDWKNLLLALEFSTVEVNAMMVLGSQLRSTLIEIGRTARQYMADAVSREDLERVLSHEVITKQLDEFGDAVFVLGMVTAIGASDKTCEPAEIRRVLRK
jgi:hypothetical protein